MSHIIEMKTIRVFSISEDVISTENGLYYSFSALKDEMDKVTRLTGDVIGLLKKVRELENIIERDSIAKQCRSEMRILDINKNNIKQQIAE